MLKTDFDKFWCPAFDNLDEIVFIINGKSELVRVNKYYLSFLNKKEEEVIGKKCCLVLHGKDEAMQGCPCCKIQENPIVLRKDYYEPNIQKWLDVRLTPVLSDKGKFYGAIVLAADITERKNTEDLLKRSQALYRAIIEDQTELVCRFLPDKTITFVNLAFCRYFGKKPEELIGESLFTLIPEQERKLIEQNFNSIGLQNPVMTHEHRVIAQNGEIRWQQWTNRAIFTDDGTLVEFQAVGHDITDRKNAEKILFASELKYRTLVEHISAITYVTMPHNFANFIYISPQFGKILGFPPESYENKPEIWNRQLDPDDRERVLEEVAQSQANNKPLCCDYRMIASDGHTVWFHDEGIVVQDDVGRPLFLQGVMYDISERKEKEEELQRSYDMQKIISSILFLSLEQVSLNEFLNLALDQVFLAPWFTFEAKGAIFLAEDEPDVLVMKAQKGLSSATREECRRVPFGKCICGKAALTKKIQFANSICKEDEACHEDRGSHGHCCIPILSSGKVLGVINLCLKKDYQQNEGDKNFLIAVSNSIAVVIVRMQAVEALKRLNDLKQALLNTIPFGIDIVDESGTIIFLNPIFEKMVGKDSVGRKCWEIYKDEKIQCPDCPLKSHINIGEIEHLETTGVFKGKTFQIFHTGIIYDGKNAVMEIFIDITEGRERERELQRAMQIKTVFTSMVSHELRTPLTAIKEGIAIVLDGTAGSLNEEQQSFLGIAKKNVDRLARMINEVLDFQKLESGRMTFDMQDSDINELVEEVRDTMLPLTDERGLDFVLNLDRNLPRAYFDRDKITQVCSNLVNNAIKCTEKGFITVTTSLGDNYIKVSVMDTGKGIRTEDMPRLFQQFEQLEAGCDRKTGGTGLGLVISRQIIEAHKGRIWAESELGKGSTFSFILPVKERRS